MADSHRVKIRAMATDNRKAICVGRITASGCLTRSTNPGGCYEYRESSAKRISVNLISSRSGVCAIACVMTYAIVFFLFLTCVDDVYIIGRSLMRIGLRVAPHDPIHNRSVRRESMGRSRNHLTCVCMCIDKHMRGGVVVQSTQIIKSYGHVCSWPVVGE